MRKTIMAGLALALLGPLSATTALAQDRVATSALEGEYEVTVTRTNARRTFAPEVEVEVTNAGRIRMRLGGKRIRMARVGDLLYGQLPRTTVGAAGVLAGAQPLPAATVTLRIRSVNELEGSVRSTRESTRITVRRVPAADAALVDAARRFVMRNAGDDPRPYPGVDSGEDGLHAYVLGGAGAERLVAFTKAWFPQDAAVRSFRLDPARQAIVAVRSTFDEEGLFVAVLDKTTGNGRQLGRELGVVDLSYTLDQATLDRLLPGMGPIDEVDHMDLIDRLVRGSTEVDLTSTFFALRYWGAPQEPVRFFRDEAEWRAWYDSTTSLEGKWAYLLEGDADTDTFVLGRDDLWHVQVKVTRATGAVELTAEH